jgi:hypothetical protein
MVRIIVSLCPEPDEEIRRAKVAFTVTDEPPGAATQPPIIWSLSPQKVDAVFPRSEKVTVGARLKIVDLTRETSVTKAMVRILGIGELQRQAVWTLLGDRKEPLIGDHEFIAIVERPLTDRCQGFLWVAFQLHRPKGAGSFIADIPASIGLVQLV